MDGSGGSSPPLQICLSASKKEGTLVSAADASYEDRKGAAEAFHSTISQYTEGNTHLPYDLRFLSPHPILITDQFLANLKQFHEALAIALSNIVQRWFTDKEADFPTRMPIEPHEEEVLQVHYHSHHVKILFFSLLTPNCFASGYLLIVKRIQSTHFKDTRALGDQTYSSLLVKRMNSECVKSTPDIFPLALICHLGFTGLWLVKKSSPPSSIYLPIMTT